MRRCAIYSLLTVGKSGPENGRTGWLLWWGGGGGDSGADTGHTVENILNHDSVQPVQMFSNPAKCNNW